MKKIYPLVVIIGKLLLTAAWERRGANWPRLSLLSCGQPPPTLWQGRVFWGPYFHTHFDVLLENFFMAQNFVAARFWIALTRWRSWDLVTLRHVACLVLNCTSCITLRWGVKRQKVAWIQEHKNTSIRDVWTAYWHWVHTYPCHVLKNI